MRINAAFAAIVILMVSSGNPLSTVASGVPLRPSSVSVRLNSTSWDPTSGQGSVKGGSVWAWGGDWVDQLGVGSESNNCDCVDTPVPVPNLTDIVQVAGGGNEMALDARGRVWTWGSNDVGEAGNGSVSSTGCQCRAFPAMVKSIHDIVRIAAGYGSDLALQRDGTVWSWGLNDNGQLGLGTVGIHGCRCAPLPAKIPGLPKIRDMSDAHATMAAITPSGYVWTWGEDNFGQLGNGTVLTAGCGCRPTPGLAKGIRGARQVVSNGEWVLALLADGTVKSWGRALSLGTKAPQTPGCDCVDHPEAVYDLRGATAVSNNGNFNMALLANGHLDTWGNDENGQLGTSQWPGTDPPDVTYPMAVKALGRFHFTAIASSGYSGEGLTQQHEVVDWGDNFSGELGRGYVSNFGPCSCQPKGKVAVDKTESVAGGDRSVFVIRTAK